MTARHATADTTLGPLTLVADGNKLTGVYFPHHWHAPKVEALGDEVPLGEDAFLTESAEQINRYLAGDTDAFTIPTTTSGDSFEERVWAELHTIPYGETVAYGALAERLGDKALAQKVGQAVGRNPLSIVVACHRVVGANGKLTGYAGGLARKQALLELEQPPSAKADKLF
jgi:methylated-DNA-[protein]-cysteine S-methyltransferase